ncbi:beta-mannosidase [Marivivens niveibacter]|uniref:beta-mannosidase n=1 Tax=Marivivens niveibacter TaxID=1930667 RepID=A0A251WUM0_9RHOB|nr:glycoside hydrolase family 2 protein [Marivivens niveibacter]OUD08112.1 beta-mannosidase [Marivivens niveibacter]
MTPNPISLTQEWQLSDDSGSYSCAFSVPGDGVSALFNAGLISDPYWGRNEYDLRWICERDWTIRRSFVADGAFDLVLDGVDTVATVTLNGEVVAECDNAFRQYRLPVNCAGENQIEIRFQSPVTAAAERQSEQPFYIPYHEPNCPIPNGNMLRKVQCDFGWDWNIALAPVGITGDIRLETAQAPRIDNVMVWQDHSADRVGVTIQANGWNLTDKVTVSLCGQTVTCDCVDGSIRVKFDIQNPVLWWPNGHGDQALHDLTLTSGDARVTRRIGLRQIEFVTDPDADGATFKFRVNGRDIFAKGANWIPADALAGRITDSATHNLLKSAKDAHMNMIRVWGGGRYEADSFYDSCDALGLLVWQDFMFACHLYPSTDTFLDNITHEVRENVNRLQHHACLALWCGDNELVGALEWFEESRSNRDRYLVNYDRMNRAIEVALKVTDPAANWWPSSPSLGQLDFGDAWHRSGSGDMHFWSVWHEGRDFNHYRDVRPRFCSEFGFQSYPSMDVIETFTAPQDRNIASPVFESHQKNAGGNARIAETMFRYFRWPERFEDFVWLSQIQQGLAIKTAVTQWRGLSPYCMGTLIWQLNDTWPVCSWSSLDYGGGWKMLHYMAQEFYAPITVVTEPVGDELVFRAVNDTGAARVISVSIMSCTLSGQRRPIADAQVTATNGAVEAIRVARAAIADDEILYIEWADDTGASGTDHFAPNPYKTYDLPNPELTMTQDGHSVTVSSAALALFVTVQADVPGRFIRNAVTVLPDAPVRFDFIPNDPAATPTFRVRDLYSATMAPRQ